LNENPPPHGEHIQELKGLEKKEAERSGYVYLHPYPWTDPNLLQRDTTLISSLRRRFHDESNGKCTVGPSKIRERLDMHDAENNPLPVTELGVFAARRIEPNEPILLDWTPAGALDDAEGRCDACFSVLEDVDRVAVEGNTDSDGPVALHCGCEVRFCCFDCAQVSAKLYHKSVCGCDLTIFQNASKLDLAAPKTAARTLLWLRVLAEIIQSEVTEPLKHPRIAQLMPAYGDFYDFEYHFHIVRPIQILQSLGIDVFRDLEFDTWVMHTLIARLHNNAITYSIEERISPSRTLINSKLEVQHVNQLYSLFNHSCEPNARTTVNGRQCSTTTILTAMKQVEKGEELFVSYLSEEQLKEAVTDRKEMLWKWFVGECGCARCAREQADVLEEGIKA